MTQRRQPPTWVALTWADGCHPEVVVVGGLGESAEELRQRAQERLARHAMAADPSQWRLTAALAQEMHHNLVVVRRADADQRYRRTWRAWLDEHAA